MTKTNNNEQNVQPVNKSIVEMDDIEFITYADYLASPYYRAYIEAKTRASAQANDWATASNNVTTAQEKAKPKHEITVQSNKKLYSNKRGIFLAIIALLMLVILATAVIGAIEISMLNEYIAVYIKPGATADTNINIPLIDPVLGTIKSLAKVGVESNFYDTYLASQNPNAGIVTKIAFYAVPVAALLIIVFAFIGFIKAIVALFAKKSLSGFIKKSGFGFISIVIFLCGLIMAVGALFIANIEIAKVLDFILQKEGTALYCGYGLYAVIAIPIVTFICSLVGYKKVKKA